MATIREVARACEVSTATVSHVLNGRFGRVSEETRRKVLAKMRELGYRPPPMEDRQKAISTRNLGLMAEDLSYSPIFTNAYFGYVLDGILEAAGLNGWSTTVFIQRMWHQDIGQAIRRNYDGRCDGLLLLAPLDDSEAVNLLHQRGVPMVMIGSTSWLKGVSSVDIDNRTTAAAAVTYLVDRGHRRIGYIAQGNRTISSQERELGYRDAMSAAGLTPAPESVFSRWDLRDEWPNSAVERFKAIQEKDRPTAFVCWNDLTASQVVDAFQVAGIVVPRDVSFISIDDSPEAANSVPSLTTFRQPLQLIGKRSVELLIDHVRDGNRFAETVRFSTQLIERESVATLTTKRVSGS
ncbi:MAG: LacI family DNA-binding transcriptional regulator [Fimbriimonas sp.]|nr:LacI family DNA-binding transcriptional regulator [Fimbriimonas sp.]